MEGTEWTARDQDDFAIKHKAATTYAVLVAKWPHVAQPLAAGDLSANDPIERTAVGEFSGTFGNHASAMNVFRFFAALAFVLKLLRDPFFEVLDRVGADTKFDEMERHTSRLTRIGALDHHDLRAFHNLLTGCDRELGYAAGERRA